MILRPPRSTRTDTLFPDTALFRSRAPIAAGIFEQSFVLGNPDVAPFTPHPPVEDDRCNLPAFACASSVTKKVAHAIGVPLGARLQGATLVVGLEPARQIAGMGACGIDQGLGLSSGSDAFSNETR